MNTSHYPNIELCKKATELGFPNTNLWFVNFTTNSWYPYWRDDWEEDFYVKKDFHISWITYPKDREDDYWAAIKDEIKLEDSVRYVCPSIAELLDELPHEIEEEWKTYWLCTVMNITVVYSALNWISSPLHTIVNDKASIPNALLEMWIWCKENGYIK